MGTSALTRTEDTYTPTTIRAEDRPDRQGVQGMVYAGFGSLPAGRFVLLRIVDAVATRRWLAAVTDQVTGAPAAGAKFTDPTAVQVAFTCSGLTALGVRTTSQDFSRPFVEGIHTEHRRRILGDEGTNAPDRWAWGGPTTPVDLAVLTYAADGDAVIELVESLDLSSAGVEVVASVPTQMLPEGREHFGFRDGLSQPRFAGEEGMADPDDRTWSLVSPGEFVLGAVDQAEQRAPIPTVAASSDRSGALRPGGRDGTYLVLRQLRQDVAGFRAWTLGQARGDRAEAAAIAAKVVGRNADGTPLVPFDPASGVNDFGFAQDDPYGEHCPIGSHIHRANPRDGRRSVDETGGTTSPEGTLLNTKRHRILRRGRAYGEPLADGAADDGADRGLLFVALNADIERQFEFVQHHWLNSATFARPGEIDPLVGRNDGGYYSVPVAGQARDRHAALPQFVTTVGGAYFFLPSLPALRYLAHLD